MQITQRPISGVGSLTSSPDSGRSKGEGEKKQWQTLSELFGVQPSEGFTAEAVRGQLKYITAHGCAGSFHIMKPWEERMHTGARGHLGSMERWEEQGVGGSARAGSCCLHESHWAVSRWVVQQAGCDNTSVFARCRTKTSSLLWSSEFQQCLQHCRKSI